MSFIDSILGRSKPEQTPQPVQPVQQATPDPQPVNPLDVYKKMYENNETLEGPPSFVIDDKVLQEVSGKLNFTSGIDKELMQRAQSGDAQAMIDLIQSVSQQSYSAALKHTTALTDAHLNRRGEYDAKALKQNVKQSLTYEALSAIPNSSHPVVKNELVRIAESLAKQNPDASPADIAKAAQEYFTTVHNAMHPQHSQSVSASKAGEITDWEAFLSN